MKIVPLFLIPLLFSCVSEKHDSSIQDFSHPAPTNTSLPHLVKGGNGNLYFSWIDTSDSTTVSFQYSQLLGKSWTEPEVIAKGSNWFINWADYPMIAANANGDMIAHFLVKSTAGTYSYDINVATKPIYNASWNTPFVPHKDRTPSEHGFVSMVPLASGTFQVAWLDGRNTGGGHDAGGAMTIRTAEISADGEISNESELDNRVCDCCQTAAIATPNGTAFYFRNRSELEIRDIYTIRKVGTYLVASTPLSEDNWKIEGCPVNGPRADSKGEKIAVAWFTGANGQPKVNVIFSDNAGESYGKPILVDGQNPLGRVDVALVGENQALVTWLSNDQGKAIIKGRIVSSSGRQRAPFNIAETSEARSSGFPQMAVVKDYVYFAWTQSGTGGSSIRMKKVAINQLMEM